MATLNPTAAKGLTQFEAAAPWRAHDDAADKKVSGAYSHEPKEFSATECDEQVSFQMFLQALLKAGLGALPVRCTGALAKGDLVYVSAFDATNQVFTAAKADGADPAKPAQFVMHAALGANTNGYAYTCGLLSNLDTSCASAAGAAVYLSATTPGAWTTTAPTAPQKVGYCTVKNATTGAISFTVGGVKGRDALFSPLASAPPTGPVVGERWFEAVVGIEWFWNGTYWLSTEIHSFRAYTGLATNQFSAPFRSDYDVFVLGVSAAGYVNSPNSGSAYWILNLLAYKSSGYDTVATLNTSADSAAVMSRHENLAVNAWYASNTHFFFDLYCAPNGSPGTILYAIEAFYRLARK
jgi:hypothetical protein